MGHPVIDDDEDNFLISGPNHMRSNGADSEMVIDWDNAEHRRCVLACLVKGTCVMENDRLKCRTYNDAELAPVWWQSFGFEREKVLVNNSDENHQFTYGAIFKLTAPSPSAPEHVIAFRGTMLTHPKAMEELVQDFWVVFNALSDYTRYKRAHPEVGDCISSSRSVWLAGHSLGASMALEIGRNLKLDEDKNVPTFLFNAPHVSPAAAINKMFAEKHKTRIYTVSFMVKFGLANVLPWYHKGTKQQFKDLAQWVPELYLNPDDIICRGYIDYFVQREKVSMKYPRVAKTAARVSYRDMSISMLSNKSLPSLLPSARLCTSTHKKEPHGLRQWWKPDRELKPEYTAYGYPVNASYA